MLKKVLVCLLAMLVLAGCSAAEETVPTQEAETTQESATVPDVDTDENPEDSERDVEPLGPFQLFTAEDMNGNEVTQDIFAEHDLTVINIWGTFCGPCINEMPELAELADEYAEKNVQVIGLIGDAIDMDGQILPDILTSAQSIIDQTGADYLHILPTNELFYNVMPQITAYPFTVFVDSEGKQVDYAYMGAADKATWAERVDNALSLLEE